MDRYRQQKNLEVSRPRCLFVLKAVKANPILWLPHGTSTTILSLEEDDLQTCINDRMRCRSYFTWRNWSGSWGDLCCQKKGDETIRRECFNLGMGRVNETFKPTERTRQNQRDGYWYFSLLSSPTSCGNFPSSCYVIHSATMLVFIEINCDFFASL